MSKILSAGLVAGVSGRRMQRLAVLILLLVSALTFTGGASAALRIGVADDLGRSPDQSVWFLDSLGELGMSENRITVNFDPAAPTTIRTSGSSISTFRSQLYAVFARSSRCLPPGRRRSPRTPTQRSSTPSTSRSCTQIPHRRRLHHRQRAQPAALLAAAVRELGTKCLRRLVLQAARRVL